MIRTLQVSALSSIRLAVFLLANCVVLLGEPAPKRSAAELAKDPASVLPQLRLGEAYLRAGETEKGLTVLAETYRALEVLAVSNPKSERVHYALGLCSLFRGEKDEAELSFQRALELAPDLELASLGLAKIYAEEGSFYRASSTIRKALERSPSSEALRRTLADLLVSNGKPQPAVELYRGLVDEFPDNPEYAECLIALYFENGDIEGATGLLDRLVETGTTSSVDRDLRLLEARLQFGIVKEVPRLLQRVRRAEPEQPMLDDYFARYYYLLGRQSINESDWSRATLYFNRSLEYSPSDSLTRQALGSAYLQLDDFEAANEQFMLILESNPNDPHFYADFARAQFGLGNSKLAFQVIDKAYELSKARGDVEAISLFKQTRSDILNTLRRRSQEARSIESAGR